MALAAINTFTLGPWDTNCYVVSYPPDPACWVVDVGFEPGELIDAIAKGGLSPRAVILTHAHLDHIGGVDELLARFPGVSVMIHEAEGDWLRDPRLNLSAFMGAGVTAHGPDRVLHDADELTLAGRAWRVLHVPGHSPGGIGLYSAGDATVISGDALFAGSIGRTDFPGSSMEVLAGSIRSRLYALPDDTAVLPGHGPPTTIGREKRSNPYVRGPR